MSALFTSVFVRLPSSSSNRPMFSGPPFVVKIYFKISFYCPPWYWPASVLIGHTNFLSAVANSITVVLSCCLTSLQVAIHFLFCLISRKRSLLTQEGLLPHLLDLWHFEIACSCAVKKWYLKSDQYWWTLSPPKAVSHRTLLFPRAAWSLLSPYPGLKFWWKFSFCHHKF